METFEIRRREIHRTSSTRPPSAHDSVQYILTIAGIILITAAILTVSHFVLGYKDLSFQITSLQKNTAEKELTEDSFFSNNPEKLIGDLCHEEYCLTEDCVKMASRIITSMNTDADPCEDFYEYACGGYLKTVVVPLGEVNYTPFQETRLILFQNIRSVMEKPPKDNDTLILNKMKKIYHTCSNMAKRSERQKVSMFTWLDDMNLSFNDGENEIEPHLGAPWPWRTIVSKLEEYQVHTVFQATFKSSSTTPIEKIVIECPIDLFLPEVYFEVNQENLYKLQVYKEVIDGVLSVLSIEKTKRQEFIEDVLQMETEIARVFQDSETTDIPSLSDEQIMQLKEIWRPMIGEAIQESEIIISCNYNLARIITTLNQAPPRMSARFVMWRMLLQVTQYLGEDLRNLQLYYTGYVPFWKSFFDKNWHACAEFLRDELGLASYKALTDSGFIKSTHLEEIKRLFQDLKAEYSQFVNASITLDDLTKNLFRDKFESMQLDFGYSDIIHSPSVLDEVYNDLEIGDDYFQNVMNVKKFKARYFFNRLWYGNSEEPVSQITLVDSPLGVDHEYDYQVNKITMDSSIFKFPLSLYLDNIPKHFKFAETSLLASMMSHSFDATGVLYDANGKKWQKALGPERHLHAEKNDYYTECFLNHTGSSDFYFSDINGTELNGEKRIQSIDTLVADMNLYQVPFESLSKYLQNSSDELNLPGINLDSKKLFYVQIAQKYCDVRVPVPPIHHLKKHLSSRTRVNMAVSNTEEFANVFTCSPQSTLNLPVKCNL